ncbi:uncharacterized mitochondrial protein-like protein [Tanacetum coccineum]
MLVQVYVDDIIFGSTKSSMVKDFEDLMQKEFKMSSMGELTFFLGLQVKQSNGGIFISQDKYVKDILNKFDFRTIKPASTPIEAHKSLGKDEEGEDVDVHLYRFQVTPRVSHLHAVKRSLSRIRTEVLVLPLGQQVMQGMLKALQLKVLPQCQSAAHTQRPASISWLLLTLKGLSEIQRTADFPIILDAMRDFLDIYALNREVRRLKKQTRSQAKLILKAQSQAQEIVQFRPSSGHTSCSFGNKDEGTLSEEHRKSYGTEESVKLRRKKHQMIKRGETEEIDFGTTPKTARQGTITPRTLNFEDEAGPSSPLRSNSKLWTLKNNIMLLKLSCCLSLRPRGTDPKDKGKGILLKKPKKKKIDSSTNQSLGTTNDEEECITRDRRWHYDHMLAERRYPLQEKLMKGLQESLRMESLKKRLRHSIT